MSKRFLLDSFLGAFVLGNRFSSDSPSFPRLGGKKFLLDALVRVTVLRVSVIINRFLLSSLLKVFVMGNRFSQGSLLSVLGKRFRLISLLRGLTAEISVLRTVKKVFA